MKEGITIENNNITPEPKQKNTLRSILVAVLVVLIGVLAVMDTKQSLANTKQKMREMMEVTETVTETTTETTTAKPEYKVVDLKVMFDEMKDDMDAVQKKYIDCDIETKGEIEYIDEDNKTICMGVPDKYYMFSRLLLQLENVEQLKGKKQGDIVTVQCHLNEISVITGYYGDLVKVK